MKIMIVDDLPANRDYLKTLLGYSGHRLSEACDGSTALALAGGGRPHLIITDIVMPVIDGLELLRRLRADPATSAIPVILYSAITDRWKSRALAQADGVHHLGKPSDPEEVLRLVEEVLAAVPRVSEDEPQ